MNNLYIILETATNGSNDSILAFFSSAAILCGIFVVLSKNPITSLFFLIGLFLNIACYLIILGLSFIGLSYLLVYVGAVSILFLFILMLINVRVSELLSETSKSIPLAIITAVSFYYPILEILPNSLSILGSSTGNIYYILKDVWTDYLSLGYFTKIFSFFSIDNAISFVTSNSWDGNLAEINHIVSLGYIIYSCFSPWLILTSVILLLAMVGAIIITLKQKRK